MTTVLEVKNYARYQHYKDRNPPWIKLYTALLSDIAFVGLPEVSRYHLIALWIVASRSEGILPDDGRVLSRLIVADTPVDVNGLVGSGFLVRRPSASVVLASRTQDAPETLYPENRGQNNNNTNRVREREDWMATFTPDDRATVVAFLGNQTDHQSEVWTARLSGYLKGLDMPGGKRATSAAIATAIRDLDGGEVNPARLRRYVERAMVDAANPIASKVPLPKPGGGITAKLAAIGRKGS